MQTANKTKNRDSTSWHKVPTNPRPFAGETVFVIGGGKSLKGVDLSCLEDRRVIGTNMAYSIGPRVVDALYFHDVEFFEANREGLDKFPNPIYTHCHKCKDLDGYNVMFQRSKGVSMAAGRLCFNSSSGGAAMNLAAQMGAKRIVLLGYDMHNSGDERNPNWHNENAIANKRGYGIKNSSYEVYRNAIDTDVAQGLRREGISVIDCSVDGLLTAFPKMTLAEYMDFEKTGKRPQPRSKAVTPPETTIDPTKPLIVASVWRESADFPIESVIQLHEAAKRATDADFRFVCLTDAAGAAKAGSMGLGDIQWIVGNHPDWHGWWSKLELFRPDLFQGRRVVYFDLDTAIMTDFAKWGSNISGLNLIRDLYTPDKLATGVMAWTGDHAYIYSMFLMWKSMNGGFPRGSDQTWLRTWLPKKAHFGFLQDVAKIISYKKHVRGKKKLPIADVICFHGKPRPQDVDEPWLNKYREGLSHGSNA